uniref:Uncharacterized protein n=1 Tax=Tanacetum cinerariifolium TaxID=118510 RepID=A0A699N0W6_TANCI|nr:hypothetical protein [Tanacetum cinerariifolium]GFB97420.1 hypothetical protein [Tanacetum cinerariifolium]
MYGALIPNKMINQDIKDSKAYKNYLDFATGKATLKIARKFKKVASPLKRLSPILEKEPVEKPKRAKKLAKKYTTMPTIGVVIRDTPGVSVSKKNSPTKKSKLETYKLHASGSSDGTGNSKDNDSNEDDSDDVTNDDDVDSDADGDNEESDSEKTNSNKDENLNLNQNEDEEEEYEKEEYVRTLDNYEITDDEEEYEESYKDVNVRLRDVEHGEEGKKDVENTNAGHDAGTQETTYEKVKDDEHVILTTVHDTQKTEVLFQSSSMSYDFAN